MRELCFWLICWEGSRGQREGNRSLFMLQFFGQLSNQRLVWFDNFSLTESLLPTVTRREAPEPLEASGAGCLHRRLEARPLLGVQVFASFVRNISALVNAHLSVSLCITHVGMWHTVNFRLCLRSREQCAPLPLLSYTSPDVQPAWSEDTSALLQFSIKSAGTKQEWVRSITKKKPSFHFLKCF